jgi:iron complex outermembrane receptor protein
MTRDFVRVLLLTTSLLGVSTAIPAYAQGAARGNESDIVVTARRVEERLQDVPISITVFNQQQLSNRNVVNAQDLAAYTPSLSVTTGFGAENSTFAIRGFVQETGTAPSVGVYFGDVVAPRGASIGFPAGDGAGPGAFFDLQNVQVLKGPQGTLFGRNTTGGAVLLVPQKPTGKFEGYVEGSIGNYDMRRLQAVVNVPVSDTFRVRVGFDRMTRDGWAINDSGIGPSAFDNVAYWSVRASAVADLTPNLENYTIISYTNSDNNGHVLKTFACLPGQENPFTQQFNLLGIQACRNVASQNANGFYHVNSDYPDSRSQLNQWQIINTTTWQATDNLTVKNIASYAELATKLRTALFGTHFVLLPGDLGPGFPTSPTPVGFAGIRHIPGGDSSHQSTFTEEFRLQGNSFANKLNWQSGFYFEDSQPMGFTGSQSPVFIGCSNPDAFVCTDVTGGGAINYTAAKNRYRTIGLYAQGTWAFTDQLKLTAGFRYTWDTQQSISRQVTYNFPITVQNASPNPLNNGTGTQIPGLTQPGDYSLITLPLGNGANIPLLSGCTRIPTVGQPNNITPNCEFDLSKSSHKPTWLIDLDYTPVQDVMLYAKYSRGYRSGGIKSDVPIEFVTFDPEKVDAFEIGAKTGFHSFISGTFNVAGFYNDFSNQQIQLGFNRNPLSPVPVSPTAGPVNVGKSRIWGVEVDTRLRLFEGFTLDGAYTHLDTKVKEIALVTLPPTSPYVVSGTIVAGDELTLSPHDKFTVTGTYTLPTPENIGSISFSATYSYTSSQRANYIDRVAIPIFGYDLGILPAVGLLNLNVNWDNIAGEPVDLALFATNVTKEQYFTTVNGLLPSTGFETASLGEPRMYGARLRYRFGAGGRGSH